MLPQVDEDYLKQKGLAFTAVVENGILCVVIEPYALPPGYDHSSAALLLRLPPGYPDAQPDMFWLDPPVRVQATGTYPQAADLMENYLGRTWQRFSRHLNAGVWKPGVDSLASYLSLIGAELIRSSGAS